MMEEWIEGAFLAVWGFVIYNILMYPVREFWKENGKPDLFGRWRPPRS